MNNLQKVPIWQILFLFLFPSFGIHKLFLFVQKLPPQIYSYSYLRKEKKYLLITGVSSWPDPSPLVLVVKTTRIFNWSHPLELPKDVLYSLLNVCLFLTNKACNFVMFYLESKNNTWHDMTLWMFVIYLTFLNFPLHLGS